MSWSRVDIVAALNIAIQDLRHIPARIVVPVPDSPTIDALLERVRSPQSTEASPFSLIFFEIEKWSRRCHAFTTRTAHNARSIFVHHDSYHAFREKLTNVLHGKRGMTPHGWAKRLVTVTEYRHLSICTRREKNSFLCVSKLISHFNRNVSDRVTKRLAHHVMAVLSRVLSGQIPSTNSEKTGDLFRTLISFNEPNNPKKTCQIQSS